MVVKGEQIIVYNYSLTIIITLRLYFLDKVYSLYMFEVSSGKKC